MHIKEKITYFASKISGNDCHSELKLKILFDNCCVQCNLDLVTLNLVTNLQRPFFNLLHKIILFSDINMVATWAVNKVFCLFFLFLYACFSTVNNTVYR